VLEHLLEEEAQDLKQQGRLRDSVRQASGLY
jgi:hypothetical protein